MSGSASELGRMMRAFRGRAGLTQEELAGRADVSPQSVGNIERGITLHPRADVLERLVDALALAPGEEDALRRVAQGGSRRTELRQVPVVPPAPLPDTVDRGAAPDGGPPDAVTFAEQPALEPWRGGSPVSVGGRHYLVHEPVELVRRAPNLSWAWHDAAARSLDPPGATVWLRRVASVGAAADGGSWHRALATQHRLLTELSAAGLVPTTHDLHEEGRGGPGWSTILVHGLPPETKTLRQVFGPSDRPLVKWEAISLLDAMVPLCASLAELHRLQFCHRRLSPDGVLVVAGGRRATLRDLGLAGSPTVPDEGWPAYRAPEQSRQLPAGPGPGPWTDVYQVSAVLYHVLTGHAPTPPPPPPLAATNPDLPLELDEVLRAALSPLSRDRPPAMDTISSVLRWAAERLRRTGGA